MYILSDKNGLSNINIKLEVNKIMNRWYEDKTDEKILKAGTVLFHNSDEEIEEFRSIETCFFTEDRGSGHNYKVTLLDDVFVEYYGYEEVRFVPCCQSCKVEYIGWHGQSKETGYKFVDKRNFENTELIEVEAE